MTDRVKRELDSINIPLQGVNLIEAAAGTGKTHNIQNLAARMIVEKDFPINSIVIVTFTEKAAAELTDRLRIVLQALIEQLESGFCSDGSQQERANDLVEAFVFRGIPHDIQLQRLRNAMRDFDENHVSTIHGFCARVLAENAFESSVAFRVRLEQNMDFYINKLLNDFCRIQLYAPRPLPGVDKLQVSYLAQQLFVLMRKDSINMQFSGKVYNSREELYEVFDSLHDQIRECDLEDVKDFLTGKLKTIKGVSGDDYICNTLDSLSELLENRDVSACTVHRVIEKLHPDILLKNLKKKTAQDAEEYILDPDSGSIFEIAREYCSTVQQDCRVFLELEAFRFVRDELELWKKRENFQGFDDLLCNVEAALNKENSPLCKALHKRFLAGIIDEFQDTDSIQYGIFRKIFVERHDPLFFMVGDPRQAIYSFRGGDLATYMRAAGECSNIFTLQTNYRSSARLIEAFNMFFAHNSAFASDEISFDLVHVPARPRRGIMFNKQEITVPLSCNYLPATEINDYRQIRKLCAREIAALLNSKQWKLPDGDSERAVTPGDIAVLAHDRFILEDIRQELQKFNIPVIADNKEGIWKSPEALEIEKIMRCVLDSSNRSLLRETLLSELCGISLAELDKNLPDAAEKLSCWRADFERLKQRWQQSGIASMLQLLGEQFKYRQRMAKRIGGERSISNISQLSDLLAAAEMNSRLFPHGVLKFLQEKITIKVSDEDSKEMLASDRSAVKLMTIHASKGLQFPIVFLPELSARYPMQKKSLKVYHVDDKLCCNPDNLLEDAQKAAAIEELQEQLRLVYVAVTRACYYCRVIWGDITVGKEHTLITRTPLDWLFRMRYTPCDKLNDRVWEFTDPDRRQVVEPYHLPETLCEKDPFNTTSAAILKFQQDQQEIFPPPSMPIIANSWRITSYSALPLGIQQQIKPQWADEDIYAADYDLADEKSSDDDATPERLSGGIWNIPGGAAIGNAWHKILENMDFTAGVNSEYVSGVMRIFNFTSAGDHSASCDMFEKLLNYTLPCGMRLAELAPERKLTELEFLLSCGNGFTLDSLCQAVSTYIADEFNTPPPGGSYFSMNGGFFTGFMDMVFEYNGKFYIVDWKSNSLNCDPEEFYGDKLKMNMCKKNYHMQYLCYTAALMKYLAWKLNCRLNETLYEQYFGEVYYIFLRGMTLPHPGGVFAARPPFQAVKALAEVIAPGKEVTCG